MIENNSPFKTEVCNLKSWLVNKLSLKLHRSNHMDGWVTQKGQKLEIPCFIYNVHKICTLDFRIEV